MESTYFKLWISLFFVVIVCRISLLLEIVSLFEFCFHIDFILLLLFIYKSYYLILLSCAFHRFC